MCKTHFAQKLICESNRKVTFCRACLKFYPNYWEKNFLAHKGTAVLSEEHQWIARKYLTVAMYFSFPLTKRCILLTYITRVKYLLQSLKPYSFPNFLIYSVNCFRQYLHECSFLSKEKDSISMIIIQCQPFN